MRSAAYGLVSLLLTNTTLPTAAAAATTAAAADPKATAAKPASTTAQENASVATPKPVAGFRTFGGGYCLSDPKGKEDQFAALAALLIPQLVSAGIDLMSSALDEAGKDHVVAKSAVIPLEYAVRCVQVVRGYRTPSSDFDGSKGTEPELQADLKRSPFLVELFLRQSRDASALLVTPTILNYQETLEGKHGKGERDLYLTLTFTDASGGNPAMVTLPLGSFAPAMSTHHFDPMMGPYDPKNTNPLGAANSIWIANPFHRPVVPVPSSAATAGTATSTPAASEKQLTAGAVGVGSAAGVQRSAGDYGPTHIPAPPRAQGATAAKTEKATTAPTPVRFAAGDPIAPFSISVAIIETRPGSAFARALSSFLKGSKQGLVDASDPSKRAAILATENAAADGKTAGWITARSNYSTALQAFCNAKPPDRPGKAPALYAAQLTLETASMRAGQTLPFNTVVNPDTGANRDAVCAVLN